MGCGMKFILIAILVTAQGNFPYTERFEFNYLCQSRLQELQQKYPGTTGNCMFGG